MKLRSSYVRPHETAKELGHITLRDLVDDGPHDAVDDLVAALSTDDDPEDFPDQPDSILIPWATRWAPR